MHRITPSDAAEFGAAILICEFAGFIGSLYTSPFISGWYATLQKPALTPPNAVFPIVWLILYAVMGISLGLICRNRTKTEPRTKELALFAIQLLLTVAWSIAFFASQNPLLGLIILVALWFAAFLTATSFFRVSRIAGILLIPYISWVTFALYLNAGILALNASIR